MEKDPCHQSLIYRPFLLFSKVSQIHLFWDIANFIPLEVKIHPSMFFLSLCVQAVNIVEQCFNERLFFLQKGTSKGSLQHPVCGDAPACAACLELRSSALEQGQGWGYMRIRFHWLEVLHLKKGSKSKT